MTPETHEALVRARDSEAEVLVWLKNASVAIYAATEEVAAKDISAGLLRAATILSTLMRERNAWEADWRHANHSCIKHLQTIAELRAKLAEAEGLLRWRMSRSAPPRKAWEEWSDTRDAYFAATPSQGQPTKASGWQATHQHYKGGYYRVIARGRIEADLSPVVIYDNEAGETWVRPVDDFDQRDPFVRFAALASPAKASGDTE